MPSVPTCRAPDRDDYVGERFVRGIALGVVLCALLWGLGAWWL